jgi:hypothetical protein
MTGFLRGLFGRGEKAEEQPANSSGGFYLDQDEAKGLGNLDYMRLAKSVRRSYPTTKSKAGSAEIKQVSSMKAQTFKDGQVQASNSSSAALNGMSSTNNGFRPTPTTNDANGAGQNQPEKLRRTSDKSLDMFRSMARDIRKNG